LVASTEDFYLQPLLDGEAFEVRSSLRGSSAARSSAAKDTTDRAN
jgi:hypothetical protein